MGLVLLEKGEENRRYIRLSSGRRFRVRREDSPESGVIEQLLCIEYYGVVVYLREQYGLCKGV